MVLGGTVAIVKVSRDSWSDRGLGAWTVEAGDDRYDAVLVYSKKDWRRVQDEDAITTDWTSSMVR